MTETQNDGVIQVTLLASEISDIIYALTHFAKDAEGYCKTAPRSEDKERWGIHSRRLYALAGRLDDIR